MRLLPMLAAALAAASVAAGSDAAAATRSSLTAPPAAADSIVYAKDGNLFLTSPDGSKGYQLTRDGGYSEPSQADNGIVGALRYKQLVRLDRSGQLLNAPIDAMGSDRNGGPLGGPYEPRISPDGTRFAYDDAALSRDGSQLAMTDANGLYVAATNGPAWSGEPPYPQPDYVNPDSGFAKPTIQCSAAVKAVNPSWSPDGGLLAYTAPDGLHVMRPDCTGDRLLVPGATGAAFGTADVSVTAPPPAAAASLTGLSLRPAKFKARRGTTVRFTLSAPAKVTLGVRRIKLTVSGRAGLNRVRFKPRLKPGRYRLIANGASAPFRAVR